MTGVKRSSVDSNDKKYFPVFLPNPAIKQNLTDCMTKVLPSAGLKPHFKNSWDFWDVKFISY